jgi:hypothetical protein
LEKADPFTIMALIHLIHFNYLCHNCLASHSHLSLAVQLSFYLKINVPKQEILWKSQLGTDLGKNYDVARKSIDCLWCHIFVLDFISAELLSCKKIILEKFDIERFHIPITLICSENVQSSIFSLFNLYTEHVGDPITALAVLQQWEEQSLYRNSHTVKEQSTIRKHLLTISLFLTIQYRVLRNEIMVAIARKISNHYSIRTIQECFPKILDLASFFESNQDIWEYQMFIIKTIFLFGIIDCAISVCSSKHKLLAAPYLLVTLEKRNADLAAELELCMEKPILALGKM